MRRDKLDSYKTENIDSLTGIGHMTLEDHQRRETMVREAPRDVVALMWDYSNGYLLDWHSHESIQILYPSTGAITVRTCSSAWIVTPDKALVIPSGLNHQVKMRGTVEMRSLFLRHTSLPSNSPDCFLVDISCMLREMLRHAVSLPLDYDEDSADGRLMKVILDQVSLSPSTEITLPRPNDEKIRWIERHLLDNPADPRNIQNWSCELGVSSRTLARRFREDINMTFRDWRFQIRLVVAIRQLASGDSVAKVAHDVGFCSESAFIDRFKKATGKTPGHYFRKPSADRKRP